MEVDRIIAEIDAQIAKLQQARQLLAGTASRDGATPNRAKLKKTKTASRKLSPEGRKRISEAMKRRWAARRKSAAKSGSAAK